MGVRLLTYGGMKFRKKKAQCQMHGSVAEELLIRAGVAPCMHGRKTLVFTLCSTVFNAPHHTWEGNKHGRKGLLKSFHKISSFYKISIKAPECE